MSALLQLVGLVCLGAFLYLAWPPLLLAFVGMALIAGPELADR